jgi:hypothetical protein
MPEQPEAAAMLKPSETGRALTATGPLAGQGVAPFGNNSAETVGDGGL